MMTTKGTLAHCLIESTEVHTVMVHCDERFQIIFFPHLMCSPNEGKYIEQERNPVVPSRQFDNMFDALRREMERTTTYKNSLKNHGSGNLIEFLCIIHYLRKDSGDIEDSFSVFTKPSI